MKYFTLQQHTVILVIIVVLLIFLVYRNAPELSLPVFTSPADSIQTHHLPFAVEIAGEINAPGIYSFEGEMSMGAIIERAGGLKENVILSNAFFLTDVPNGAQIAINRDPDLCKVTLMEPEKRFLYFVPININTAGIEELEVLPGVGQKTAHAIVGYRKQHGAFARLDELQAVPGIGPTTFMKMKDYLSF